MGYQQVVIPAQQFTMIGVMYADMTNGAISVQELFHDPLGQGLTGATTSGLADQLMYWDSDETGNYVSLFLYSNTGTSSAVAARHNKWLSKDNYKDITWGAKNAVSSKKLTSGIGLWLKRYNYAAPITLSMAGAAVVAEGGRNITIKEGFNMICGGFSTDFTPNPDAAGVGDAIDWLGKGCAGGTASGLADQLMFWDTNETGNYVSLFLYSNTGTSSAVVARHNKWLSKDNYKDTSWGAKNAVSTKSIPAGRGVWYKRLEGKGSFTLNLDQPYSL